MNLNEEQIEKLKAMFETAYEYSCLAKEHSSSKTEVMSNLLDDLCPKPSGKLTQADRERYKEEKKKTKQFINDSYRIYVRDVEQVEDTTPEALTLSEMLKK